MRFAPFIDETLLAPEVGPADIDRLCERAARHRVASVCVNPLWVARCAERLAGSKVAVASVVGFPFGASETSVKVREAVQAVAQGARELDMVAGLGLLKAALWDEVGRDIRLVVDETPGIVVKVIIETALLTEDEIVRASEVVRDAGAGFVKTSTGFHAAGGATIDAVRLIRRTVRDSVGVKASGGIRDCRTAQAMFDAGATRIGTSRGAELAECTGPGPRRWAELDWVGEVNDREHRVLR